MEDIEAPQVTIERQDCGVQVVVPRLPRHFSEVARQAAQRATLDGLIVSQGVSEFVLWYYTPQAVKFSDHLKPVAIVYDCMDELSAFKNASSELPALERVLMRRADLVLTGGHSLYEAKKAQHANIHPIPSSVDLEHSCRPGGVPLSQPIAREVVIEPNNLRWRWLIGQRLEFRDRGAVGHQELTQWMARGDAAGQQIPR